MFVGTWFSSVGEICSNNGLIDESEKDMMDEAAFIIVDAYWRKKKRLLF